MAGRANVSVARDYERRIRNLLAYSSRETREMALRLLDAARRDRNVTTWQIRHLESLFGPEMRKEWFRPGDDRKEEGIPQSS